MTTKSALIYNHSTPDAVIMFVVMQLFMPQWKMCALVELCTCVRLVTVDTW